MAEVLTPATRTALGWIRAMFYRDGATWPPPPLAEIWEQVERFAAFRASNAEILQAEAGIGRRYNRYLISPVPRMISRAKANLLFGEAAEFKPADEGDAERMEFIVEENDLDALNHQAAVLSSSEGEIWGRICYRPDLLDCPIIEFVSRRRVIPFFSGRFLVGASFLTEYAEGYTEVWRLFETYERGLISAELFRGTRTSLGQPMPLTSYPATAATPELVYTGIDEPLVAFIPNSIDGDPSRGYSDYAGLEDRFLGINRATTIGDTNTELAGKKRALVDGQYVGRGGQLADDDVFVKDETEGDLNKESPMQILEYDYDAQQIVSWLDHLIDSTLTFGGAAPQLVGRALDGAAISGTALRFKMIHSLLEASGSGRYYDRGLARLLRQAAIIDSRPVGQIGFGRGWAKPDEKPTVDRQDGLPRDDLEAAQQLQLLVTAEAISVEERVRFVHPDWTQEQIDEEIAKLKDEEPEPPPRLPQVPPQGAIEPGGREPAPAPAA